MFRLKIHEDNRHFQTSEGEDFFYLADTVWSAFTNISLTDWAYYLDKRAQQGFNVLQINILPQWDRSRGQDHLHPFEQTDDGYDFNQFNERYFEHAETMVKMAVAKGFTPALVVLWCNYVPKTWASQIFDTMLMPKDAIIPYVEKVNDYFSKYHPIYFISGDTDFETEEAIEYYQIALNKLKELAPQCLTTLHIKGRLATLPEQLQQNTNLDFYLYQSGHNSSYQETAYTVAEQFYQKSPQRPIINSEPCYELMGYSRQVYGRFTRFDVRKAAWQSILSGAGAGITYGAHGIWSWHELNSRFGSSTGEGFVTPYPWRIALEFDGAWDYSFIKRFITEHHLYALEPQNIVLNKTTEIRAAKQEDMLLIYVPFSIEITLKGKWGSGITKVIELESGRTAELPMQYNNDQTLIPMHYFTGDCLMVIQS
ncbi:apiosidase-like domain-containing protein [Amphibacillus sediminis]|uniref:apiosidase-like domain-containing protein n=1 Tax=Amphibacillus sediminis TaxID=360185 RepID=UPI00082C1A48|nr:DUF4038 domain-containing protein [Amphibacillus sediminis]